MIDGGRILVAMVLWGAIWTGWKVPEARAFAGPFIRVDGGLSGQGPLYRSPQPSEEDYERYETEFGIRRLIRLNGEKTGAVANRGGIQEVQFAVPSLSKTPLASADLFISALYFLRDPKRPASLVHCLWGKDRTGVLVALYKLVMNPDPPEDVLPLIKREMKQFGFDPLFEAKLEKMLDYLAIAVAATRQDSLTRHLMEIQLSGEPLTESSEPGLGEFIAVAKRANKNEVEAYAKRHPFFLIPVTIQRGERINVPLYEISTYLSEIAFRPMMPYFEMAIFRYRLLSMDQAPSYDEPTRGTVEYLAITDARIREIQRELF